MEHIMDIYKQLIKKFGGFYEKLTEGMKHFIERRDELEQEINKFGSAIHDFEYNLNATVDMSNAQQNSHELCETEKEIISQIKELKVESESFGHFLIMLILRKVH